MSIHGKFVKLKHTIISYELAVHMEFITMFEGCNYALHDVVQYIDWLENDPSRINMQYAMRVANHMYKMVKGYNE